MARNSFEASAMLKLNCAFWGSYYCSSYPNRNFPKLKDRPKLSQTSFKLFLSMDSVRATADDAVTAKIAASAQGYFDDPFSARFWGLNAQPPKRQPIINRGTWARCAGHRMQSFAGYRNSSCGLKVLRVICLFVSRS